jgi:hypothetical protein
MSSPASDARLAEDLVPRWSLLGVDGSVLAALTAVPAVGQHIDLQSWNVVVSRPDFTVVDSESATSAGLPLWDLLYFLEDTLLPLDGTTEPERKASAVAGLFAGEARASPVLLVLVRRAVEAFSRPRRWLQSRRCAGSTTCCGLARDDALALPGAGRTPADARVRGHCGGLGRGSSARHGLESVAQLLGMAR